MSQLKRYFNVLSLNSNLSAGLQKVMFTNRSAAHISHSFGANMHVCSQPYLSKTSATNGREFSSYLGQVFNSKLDRFDTNDIKLHVMLFACS